MLIRHAGLQYWREMFAYDSAEPRRQRFLNEKHTGITAPRYQMPRYQGVKLFMKVRGRMLLPIRPISFRMASPVRVMFCM